jgi:20S proteasome alpha/beta subunit
MSLGIVIKSPEGIVLAAESRVTLTVNGQNGQPSHMVNFDNATKLFSFKSPHNHIGVVTYGQAAIGQRTAHSFVPEFESSLPNERLSVADMAQQISEFYMEQWNEIMSADYQGPNMTFIVAGFNEGEPYGRVFLLDLPRKIDPVEQQAAISDFGITWGGQREIVDRLIQGYDHRVIPIISQSLNLNPQQQQQLEALLIQNLQLPIPLNVMALQDCINLAKLFLRTTIETQELTIGVRGCGGPIEVAVIKRQEELTFIRHKSINA